MSFSKANTERMRSSVRVRMASIQIYKRIASFRTPFLYPWGWAFVLGAALGIGYAISVAIELRRCAGA